MHKMMPIGPLMIEHRLIERMIAVMDRHLKHIRGGGGADPSLIDTAVDFLISYADRCHHGKEEDILFRELGKKDLTDELSEIMEGLVNDHVFGRKTCQRLLKANGRYKEGEAHALDEIIDCMATLAEFYPKHIDTEDSRFFIPVMRYFTNEEKDAMLIEGFEFDQGLFHNGYRIMVESAEKT